MSLIKCAICADIYDTDFQLEVDEIGNCICDNCFENYARQCDCCGENKVCRDTTSNGGDVTVCHQCTK